MLVTIGRRDDGETLATLVRACHGRIREFASLAVALGVRDDVAADEVREACERCARYFREALPLHVADEDESVYPRMKGQRPEVDRALDATRAQHGAHEAGLRALLDALDALREDPTRDEKRTALARIAGPMAEAFEAHLALEEAVIIPAFGALLGEAGEAAVVSELRARRGGGNLGRPKLVVDRRAHGEGGDPNEASPTPDRRGLA